MRFHHTWSTLLQRLQYYGSLIAQKKIRVFFLMIAWSMRRKCFWVFLMWTLAPEASREKFCDGLGWTRRASREEFLRDFLDDRGQARNRSRKNLRDFWDNRGDASREEILRFLRGTEKKLWRIFLDAEKKTWGIFWNFEVVESACFVISLQQFHHVRRSGEYPRKEETFTNKR